jgi:hypothetical protein
MPVDPEILKSCKQALDKSRKDVYNAVMYLLHPDDYYPHTSDAELIRLYEVWASAAKATDLAMNAKWHPVAYGPMITMPPDEPEYKACRRMAAVVIQRSLYDEDLATHSLYDAVHHVYLNAKVCALHPVTCACHYSNGWTGTNETLLKTLRSELEASLSKQINRPSPDDDFVKNLFQTVQNVKFDSMCPHGNVVYSCMACSH